jgi:ribonuclease HII
VDQLNPKESTKQAMQQLIKRAKIKPDLCLIDAEIINAAVPTKAIIKGDQKSITIAAASIIAKVIRDQFMVAIDQQYPQYYFKEHKGYGTVKHLNALMQHGPINGFHRASYEPVKNIMLARKRKHHSKG